MRKGARPSAAGRQVLPAAKAGKHANIHSMDLSINSMALAVLQVTI